MSLSLVLVFFLSIQGNAYQMTRCELVHQLRLQRFPEDQMRDWVCLVENESERRTDVVSKPNRNGSRDHGLFQINDGIWCSNTTTPGKDCDVTCADLTTDNISKACKCTKKIFSIQGFSAWHGWTKRCQRDLPEISDCVDQSFSKSAITPPCGRWSPADRL